eukprot:2398225-Rhodomonas_salina.3
MCSQMIKPATWDGARAQSLSRETNAHAVNARQKAESNSGSVHSEKRENICAAMECLSSLNLASA